MRPKGEGRVQHFYIFICSDCSKTPYFGGIRIVMCLFDLIPGDIKGDVILVCSCEEDMLSQLSIVMIQPTVILCFLFGRPAFI